MRTLKALTHRKTFRLRVWKTLNVVVGVVTVLNVSLVGAFIPQLTNAEGIGEVAVNVSNVSGSLYKVFGTWGPQGNQCWTSGSGFHYRIGVTLDGVDINGGTAVVDPAACNNKWHEVDMTGPSDPDRNLGGAWPAPSDPNNGNVAQPDVTFNINGVGEHIVCAELRHVREQGEDRVDALSCTTVNVPGTITIHKQFDDNGDGTIDRNDADLTVQDWNWDITGGAQDNAAGATVEVAANQAYVVTEDDIPGYNEQWFCNNQYEGVGAVAFTGYTPLPGINNGNSIELFISSEFPSAECTFVNTRVSGSITGTKYYDWDHDGVTDGNDQTIPGWELTLHRLYGEGSSVVGTVNTDANGHYSFDNLEYGNYLVCEYMPNGWTPTGPGMWTEGGWCQEATFNQTVDFHNYLTGAIHGQKYNDLNGNGVRDCTYPVDALSLQSFIPIGKDCEPTLNGWTIFIDTDGDGVLDEGEQSKQTQFDDVLGDDDNGWYWFKDLEPGAYRVCEVQQVGWMQTFPNSDGQAICHTIHVNSRGLGDTCVNPLTLQSVITENEVIAPMCDFGNTYVPTPPNVTIAKTDNHTTAQQGETLTYEITLTNSGDLDATGVKVDDTVPTTFVLVDETSISDGGVYGSGHIVWNNITVPGHGSKTLTFKGTVNVPATASTYIIHNEATLGCSQRALTLTAVIDQVVCQYSGTATDDTSVTTAPTVTLLKAVDASTVKPNMTVNYSIVWSVAGTSNATNVILTDSFPATLNFVSADNGGVYDASTRTITWNLGTQAPGATGTVHVVGTTFATMANGITITNNSAIDSAETDPVFSSVASTSVVPQVLGAATAPALTITKAVNHSTAKPGDILTYTVVVTNVGDGDAVNVVVADTIPSGLSYVHATGKTRSWSFDRLAPGESKTMTYTVRVNSTAKNGVHTNVATAAADDVAMVSAQANVTVKVPQVLGLATTGTGLMDYLIAIVGMALIALGAIGLRRPKRIGVRAN